MRRRRNPRILPKPQYAGQRSTNYEGKPFVVRDYGGTLQWTEDTVSTTHMTSYVATAGGAILGASFKGVTGLLIGGGIGYLVGAYIDSQQ